MFTNFLLCQLLVLMHGSGVVRAGQWARRYTKIVFLIFLDRLTKILLIFRLIINENLDTGTQLPFIERAIKEGYAVIVTNTNDNFRMVNGKKQLIRV